MADTTLENRVPTLKQIKYLLNEKANLTDLANDVTFKGSDTTSNILAISDANVGDKYYSTDDNVYYMYSTSGWITCGSGENLRVIEEEINRIDKKIIELEKRINALSEAAS